MWLLHFIQGSVSRRDCPPRGHCSWRWNSSWLNISRWSTKRWCYVSLHKWGGFVFQNKTMGVPLTKKNLPHLEHMRYSKTKSQTHPADIVDLKLLLSAKPNIQLKWEELMFRNFVDILVLMAINLNKHFPLILSEVTWKWNYRNVATAIYHIDVFSGNM